MAFAYAVFAQFLSLEVAALLEKKSKDCSFCWDNRGILYFSDPLDMVQPTNLCCPKVWTCILAPCSLYFIWAWHQDKAEQGVVVF